MKKPVRLFKLDEDGKITKEFAEGCEWVLTGEGRAGRLWNGFKCRVTNGRLLAAFRADPENPPKDFVNAHDDDSEDSEDGLVSGWIPVGTTDPAFEYHREAWHRQQKLGEGVYELVGPHIQGNIENIPEHVFVKQCVPEIPDIQRDFGGIKGHLDNADIHGIMFEHPDGRRAFILASDLNVKRKNQSPVVALEPPSPQHGLIRQLKTKMAELSGEVKMLTTDNASLGNELKAAKEKLLDLQTKIHSESNAKTPRKPAVKKPGRVLGVAAADEGN